MDAASAEVDIDFGDLSFLDGLECFDLDLPADFDGGEFFLSGLGKDGGLDLDLGCPDDDGGRESSPDSVVTDDGAPASSGDRDDGGEMSDYVGELEKFLMEDDDGYEAGGPTVVEEEELADDDDYFFGGYYGADDGCAETMGAEVELSADDYFLDDYYVADDGYAEPGAGAAVEDAVLAEEEELATNGEYFFGDYNVTDNEGYADPAAGAGVVDPASPVLEEGDFAAREDETTSRKRASIQYPLRQRWCAGSVPSGAELVLTRRGRCISVQLQGCSRLGHHRLLCGSAWLST